MKIILTQQLQEVQWRQPREYPQTWVLRVRKPSWEMKLSCFQTYLPHVIQRYYMYLYAPNSRHFLVSLVLHLVILTSNWWSSLTEDQMFSEDKIKVVQHRSFSKFLLIFVRSIIRWLGIGMISSCSRFIFTRFLNHNGKRIVLNTDDLFT